MLQEIQASERLRDAHLAAFKDQLDRYTGPFYCEREGRDFDSENHEFTMVSAHAAQVVYENPRVRASTKLVGSQADVAQAIEHGLNRWCRDVDLRKPLQKVFVDMYFNWGVLMVTQNPDEDRGPVDGAGVDNQPGIAWKPKVARISQRRFGWDPYAIELQDSRYFFHKWVADKADLIQRAKDSPQEGWNLEALEGMSTGEGTSDLGRPKAEIDRGEIVLYEIWVPEHELPRDDKAWDGIDEEERKAFHGTIHTIAWGRAVSGEDVADAVRAPRPYYGPSTGPYTVFGCYGVPDQVAPLGPLTAMKGQVDEVNRHVKAMSVSASRRKRLAFVDALDSNMLELVKAAPDGSVIPVAKFEQGKIAEVEIGGITEQQIASVNILRERLDRNSGMNDATRGSVTGTGTATENQIADAANTARMAYIKQQFNDATIEVLRKAAWYLYHDDRTVFPLGNDAAQAMGLQPEVGPDGMPVAPEPWFAGGRNDPQGGYTFDDLELDIEPYSMERTSEAVQQRRMQEAVLVATQIAPLIPQLPYVRWKKLLDLIGDTINVPDLSEMVDFNAAAQVAGIMLDGMRAEGQPQQGKPTQSKDSGTGAGPRVAQNPPPKVTSKSGPSVGSKPSMQVQGQTQKAAMT